MEVFESLADNLTVVVQDLRAEITRQRALREAEASSGSRHERELMTILHQKNEQIKRLSGYINSIRKSVSDVTMSDNAGRGVI